jgi:excinuclease ABC subunit B
MTDPSHPFELKSSYQPTGDQPQAIAQLVEGLKANKRWQVLPRRYRHRQDFYDGKYHPGRPADDSGAGSQQDLWQPQLYGEFKELFPNNRVEYFISNFDFYQPEAYLPKTDTYIDKEVVMNDEIEMMRASAVNSLLERKDTIVVCSVASIYGLSDPNEYRDLAFTLHVGEPFDTHAISQKLIIAQYKRNDIDLQPGTFRVRGEVMEIYPPSGEDYFLRIYSDFDQISEIDQIRPTTGEVLHTIDYFPIFPAHEHASSLGRIQESLLHHPEGAL